MRAQGRLHDRFLVIRRSRAHACHSNQSRRDARRGSPLCRLLTLNVSGVGDIKQLNVSLDLADETVEYAARTDFNEGGDTSLKHSHNGPAPLDRGRYLSN